MKSLAEELGVVDPVTQTGETKAAAKKSAQLFWHDIFNTPEYRQSVLNRIIIGELPPAVEAMGWHYAHGKPVEHVQVEHSTVSLGDLSIEELEQRALLLAEVARRMRMNETDPELPESSASSSVH